MRAQPSKMKVAFYSIGLIALMAGAIAMRGRLRNHSLSATDAPTPEEISWFLRLTDDSCEVEGREFLGFGWQNSNLWRIECASGSEFLFAVIPKNFKARVVNCDALQQAAAGQNLCHTHYDPMHVPAALQRALGEWQIQASKVP